MPAATAPISRSTVKARLDDFSHHWRQRIDQWRADGQGHTEKSAAQQFWSDLFRCFGIIPERIDLFERDAVVRLAEQDDDWIQQKRYMPLTSLEQTKAMMASSVIDAREST